jgi:hypothetical protein
VQTAQLNDALTAERKRTVAAHERTVAAHADIKDVYATQQLQNERMMQLLVEQQEQQLVAHSEARKDQLEAMVAMARSGKSRKHKRGAESDVWRVSGRVMKVSRKAKRRKRKAKRKLRRENRRAKKKMKRSKREEMERQARLTEQRTSSSSSSSSDSSSLSSSSSSSDSSD